MTTLATLDEESARAFPDEHLDGEPSMSAFSAASTAILERMRAATQRGVATELYFFYSGHGDVEKGEGYVLLADAHLTRGTLFDALLEQSPARANHVIVDACKSSYLAFDKGVGGTRRPFAGGWHGDRAATLLRTGFLMSTSSGRDSHEWERFHSGVFSHEVRSALRGAADANGDGVIDYSEVGGFLASANRRVASLRYRPDFLVRAPGAPPGDLASPVIVWPPGPVVWLGDAVGHVYVETPRGERILDAHPAANQTLPLHLPTERPLYARDAAEKHERVIAGVGSELITRLDAAAHDIAAKGAMANALTDLFSAEFGHRDVDTFAAQYDITAAGAVAEGGQDAAARSVRKVALFTGAGAAAVGAGLLIWAHALANDDSGSNSARVERNRNIDRLNAAGIGALVIAGAASVVWSVLTLNEREAAPTDD